MNKKPLIISTAITAALGLTACFVVPAIASTPNTPTATEAAVTSTSQPSTVEAHKLVASVDAPTRTVIKDTKTPVEDVQVDLGVISPDTITVPEAPVAPTADNTVPDVKTDTSTPTPKPATPKTPVVVTPTVPTVPTVDEPTVEKPVTPTPPVVEPPVVEPPVVEPPVVETEPTPSTLTCSTVDDGKTRDAKLTWSPVEGAVTYFVTNYNKGHNTSSMSVTPVGSETTHTIARDGWYYDNPWTTTYYISARDAAGKEISTSNELTVRYEAARTPLLGVHMRDSICE